jgi:hypothetical protein
LLPALSVFWLVPIPLLPFLGMLVISMIYPKELASICARAYAVKADPDTSAHYRILEQGVLLWRKRASIWQRLSRRFNRLAKARDHGSTSTEETIILASHLKTCFLFCETALAGTLMAMLCQRWPELSSWCRAGFTLLMTTALALAAFGVVAVVVRIWNRQLSTDPNTAWIFRAERLASTQLIFVTALLVGRGFVRNNPAEVSGIFGLSGLLGTFKHMAPGFLSMFLHVRDSEHHGAVNLPFWLYVCLLILSQGLDVTPDPFAGLESIRHGLLLLVILAPIGCRQALNWLLRPLTLAQVRSSELPKPLRRALVFVTITALMPFGGLAIPLWLGIRRRYGPEMERIAHQLG